MASTSTSCPQCGTINPAGARFCRGCGLNLTQAPRQSGVLHSPTPGATPPSAGIQGVGPVGPTGPTGTPPQPVMAQALGGQIGGTPLAPGVTLQARRYVVDKPLGSGGMGSVFLAHDTHVNGKPVVIKEMANVYATEAERREAEAGFQAEMATLAALSHPSIPGISDYFTESNRHFAVQEYVGGADLQKAIEAAQVPGEPPHGLLEKSVLSWASQALVALEYLETQNPQIIHRDVKPGNIIVDAANRVRLVDFGIASHKYRPGSTRAVGAQVSTALGTPGYAPKEQFTGQETSLSDLYALGATMHHLLTGRDPTKVQPLWQYPPVRTLNPKVSEAAERIVARATQADPARRYGSATEMKRAVDRVLTPPGALATVRGRAVALLALLLLLIGVGGGSYVYSQMQARQRPVGAISDGGTVAFDTDRAGLDQLGLYARGTDPTTARAIEDSWINAKIQASKDAANGNAQAAGSGYQKALTINPSDAESAIYVEDQRVLSLDPQPYRIAVGGSFSPAATGNGDDVGVGRQDLQGAYIAQKTINDAGGIHGRLLYLVLANDSSSADGAQGAARALDGSASANLLALVGFAFSTRTFRAIPYVAEHGIPEISPTASNPKLNSSTYFFRTCPSDVQQGRADLDYLLGTLLKGRSHPTIAVYGDPSDTYAGGLQTLVQSEATARGATAVPENYTIGQAGADFAASVHDIKARHVDAVYFAGYAREALLLSAAMNAAGVPSSVPIMTDDAFYEPAAFEANPTPKGRFHFTAFFFPDEYSLLHGAARQNIQAMEQAYQSRFLKAGVAAGGYGTSRVSSDTALYYDAVRTVAYAIGRLPANGVTRQSVRDALAAIGLTTPAYQGVSGRVAYVTPAQPLLNGDPADKALVILHLDAARGRTHLDGFLGTYR